MSLVHELFELQAHRAPDAVAVRFGDAQLTYRELNTRANQLARYLIVKGIGPEDRVVVCVEPGFDIVVALLAIFKASAVYVPLDPSYPAARVQTMLEDTKPALLLTRADLPQKLGFAGFTTLQLDAAQAELAAFSAEDLGLRAKPHQTAYIYYTSGTTGAPKGVMATQANLASYIGVAQRRYGFTSTDVGPAIARFSFSISMFELLSPLVAGGTLLVLERSHILDFARLSETLREVTFFHAGPSLLRSLLQYVKRHYTDFSGFARVRHASSGGDMVSVEVLEGLREVFFNAEVFVIYGCSEISCMGCTYPVPRVGPLARSYVGAAFEGMTVRVVDDDLRVVPSGVVGEVLFSGPGVVPGYLNRSDLTQQRFVELDGARFYRTGDRGRFSEEGWLELVGRSDFQVKLGGIRIELGDIEHHLRRAPGVSNGVVVARDAGDGEKVLVAYVVVEAEAEDDSAARALAIRRYLAQQLPDYMLPSFYVELAALPLNHNMKIDRQALPDPPRESLRSADASPLREPETEMEQRLASLWKQALRVDRVGLDDNFFDLGGTSMRALQLIDEVDAELGVALTGLELLRESLEMQAVICEQRSGKPRNTRPPRIVRKGGEAFELLHFGRDQSLFGVLHGPRASADLATLICSPTGHEHVRAHFVLQRLARRLAADGVPVLRFDYYGCGDSLGESSEATCARWQADIEDACAELQRRTRARRVATVGVRLGATLLARVASRLDVSRTVFWDPIQNGAQYLAELRDAHVQYSRATWVPSFRLRIPSWRRRGRHELLGFAYSDAALRELGSLIIPDHPSSSCAARSMTSESAWMDLQHLEDMLPDVGISRALTELVLEGS
jgi:amino acid adenylation domain-containing protein